jgi:Fur family ferric uptake transcriptional regulator
MSCTATMKEKGLKLTPQRLLIADILHAAKGHITAGEIIEHVQTKMPGVNKSTIYRTLDILEEAGCVYKSELGNEVIYHHDDEGHHHHLVCRQCGQNIECDESVFSSMQEAIKRKYGFHGDFQHLVIDGLCRECKKKEN